MTKWKNAASVIIAASISPLCGYTTVISGLDIDYRDLSKEKPDFQILALKRSSESPILPGHYVFPGGTVNVADSSDEWIQLFKKNGYCLDLLCKILNNNNSKLPILEESYGLLPQCISLRITAIREAFEESGLLFCKKSVSKNETECYPYLLGNLNPSLAKHLQIDDIDSWRKKVTKNPNEFFNLCINNDCYPDVVSLYLWSNWLAPSIFPIRFNSVIFTIFTEGIANATQDNYEIESLKWTTAHDLLLNFHKGDCFLYYPQFYEISRLARFVSFSNLSQHAAKINGYEKLMVWMPVKVYAKDGEITILPGDGMYPKNLDYLTPFSIMDDTKTVDSFKCHQMNRMVTYDSSPTQIKLVISNLDENSVKHVIPWCPNNINDYLFPHSSL